MPVPPSTSGNTPNALHEFNNTLQKINRTNEVIALSKIAKSRKGKAVKRTCDHFEKLGYPVAMRRVTWAGGVGTYRWYPRLKKYRLQIAANVWADQFLPKTVHLQIMPGWSETRTQGKHKRFYKYALCIEV